MRVALLVTSSVLGLAGLVACGGSGDSDDPTGPAAMACASPPYFSVSPVALGDIEAITVVGGLGAPGHTLPTAQAGFYLATEGAVVRAPGAMSVTGLRRTTYLTSPNRQGTSDYTVDFSVCREVTGWFGHLTTLSAAIPATVQWTGCSTYSTPFETVEACSASPRGISLTAGQELGTGGQSIALGLMGLDFGLLDSRVTNIYVADWRFPEPTRRAVCPWDRFEPSVQSQLYGKLADKGRPQTVPAGTPRCGTMEVDVAGTAKGVWALPSETAPVAGNETGYITLANYPYRPNDELALSLGVPSLGGTMAFVARGSATARVNRPFEHVTNDGLVYCYGPALHSPSESWLVQLTGPSSLSIKRVVNSASSPCADPPSTWSMSGAISMVR